MTIQINDVIPIKIMVEFKEDGTFDKSVLLYKLKLESGEKSRKTYSISIDTQISVPVMNSLINKAKSFAKTQEKTERSVTDGRQDGKDFSL
jgi:hypothetical protein